jgi:hypothetical protein
MPDWNKERNLNGFEGFHSEWNLGSPGGWDYQRLTQIIGKAVWERINQIRPVPVQLDFDHPLLYPINDFVKMLISQYRQRDGRNPGLVAVIAEEETLEDVTENINLAHHLSAVDGLTGVLMAPHELERVNGRVCWQGQPITLIFMDFNTDVLLKLHRKNDLTPLLQAVREHRVINPRGTEPINVKSMFEVMTTRSRNERFHSETIERTPWTRQFYPRRTVDLKGDPIDDLIEWTRRHWQDLVLKPERGYSGHGVRVGGDGSDPDEAIDLALREGSYIVQQKIQLPLWSEEMPILENGEANIETFQTDFRCLMGPGGLFGFLGRYGGVPTNVGSGGGVQPLAILKSEMSVRDAVGLVNEAIAGLPLADLAEVVRMQEHMALEKKFTYLLGPIKIALRPRILQPEQLKALQRYCNHMWQDCLTLEQMWFDGALDDIIKIEEEELEIARMDPWKGSPAIIASDGLFNFGANVG